MSTKSDVDSDHSNGLSIAVEQSTIKKNLSQISETAGLFYLYIILTVTIFYLFNRMERTNFQQYDEAALIYKGG